MIELDVAIIGGGFSGAAVAANVARLTALDVLVALKACGHRGRVHVLSRGGRFPKVRELVALEIHHTRRAVTAVSSLAGQYQ